LRTPSFHQPSIDYAARITAALGTEKVARLTVTQVERFLADAAAEGVSADMLRRLRSTLRLAIRRAERDGKATRNVAALAETPAAPRRQSRSMNLEQIRALLGLGPGARSGCPGRSRLPCSYCARSRPP